MNRKFLLGVFAFLLLLFSFPKAHALEGWQYAYVVTIQNQTDKDLTDYQVKIVLDSSNFDFSQANTDGSDVRFYDGQGNKLPYWIESWDSSGQTAVIWVKVPSIPANGSAQLLMYVGNPEATSESDPLATFDWYDDGSTDRLSEYTIVSKGADVSLSYDSANERYIFHNSATSQESALICTPVTGESFEVSFHASKAGSSTGEDWILYAVWYSDTTSVKIGGHEDYYAGSTVFYERIVEGGTTLYNVKNSTGFVNSTTIVGRFDSPHYEGYTSRMNRTFSVGNGTVSGTGTACIHIEFDETYNVYFDNIRVRKYVYPEPTASVTPKIVTLAQLTTAVEDLAVDPEGGITSVTVDYRANMTDPSTYYRTYVKESNITLVEGTDAVTTLDFSATFDAIGDYTVCAYVETASGTDESCVTTHIDQFPQNVDLDLNDTLIFPGDLVEFNGSATDNGAIVSYSWDFGDGSTATGDVNTHTYATEGTYTVKLTVTDDLGLSKTVSEVIKVYAPPVVRVSRTDDVVEYAVGVESPLVVSSAEWNLSNGTTLTGESVQVSGEEIIYDGNVTFTVTDGVQSQTFERNVPVATINYTVTEGFQPDTQDSVSYSTTFYGGTPTCVFMQDGEEITDTATWKDGGVTFYLECNTPTEEVTVTDSVAVTVKHVMLIDQATGSDANLAEMESVVLKDIDSGQLYDFKANGTTEVYFIKAGEVSKKLRLEMQVATIEDLISIDLITDNVDEDVRLCAGDDFTQFQIITSNAVKPIFVENIYAKCYAWAGRTDYAYQTGMMAKVYTGDYLYAIYTLDGSNLVALGSIDGAYPNTVNLDAISYTTEPLTFSIVKDQVSMEKIDENTVKLYYKNAAGNNLRVTIRVKDDSTVYFESTYLTSPNEVQVYLVSPPIPKEGYLVLEIEAVRTDGSVETIRKYFTFGGAIGNIHPNVAIGIAVFLLLFTITLFATGYALGYIGAIGTVAGLGVLAMAPQTPTVIMVEGLLAIVLVFIIVTIRAETGKVV